MNELPHSAPRAQLYYWTAKWQLEEAEALDELARGEGHEFESAADAIRWLDDKDDSELHA